jgi:peptidoglycan/LPS O-acetylase OafA/YrhL
MKRPDLPVLTTLRFPAAFAIVLYHFLPFTVAPLWLWDGFNAGVSFFYVLSGFILYYNYAELKDRGFFWVARFARIWPIHLATALLAIATIPWRNLLGHASWPVTLPANLLLLHAWLPFKGSALSYNGVSWSLSVAAFFSLTFPWLLVALNRRGAPVLVTSAFALGFILVLIATMFFPQNAEFVGRFNPAGRLFEFVLGMATGRWWMQGAAPTASDGMWLVREFALAILSVVLMIGVPAAIHLSGFDNALTQWLGSAIEAVCFAALIWVYARQSGLISKALSQRWLAWFGEISFSVYMCHQIVLKWLLIGPENEKVITDTTKVAVLFTEYLLITIALSAALFYAIETPARHAIVRAWKHKAARSPVG